ncbi:hypothetical protein BCR32DRAFT_291485 [Anaeromyces robustus]|uniref:Stealth protein CR2 conserved region 2 domain-containing protein n=1 Tax=Anaeromyces robustus TaxID=1754192 RepID=A0A1Y1XES4_9FUNG|nr:hypothetical protein BCR32DRAFT_291485 [Anaeromyces robustus]|eukprot:ORX84258.1 hypothetical protein BCR32DRAFT_291485 [Anaeromyces robustus]
MDNAGMIKKFQGAVFSTNQAIRDGFGDKNKLKWLDHSPYIGYRDLFEPARQLFKTQVQDTISHKFRHPLDLVPHMLLNFYTYYATKDVKYPKEVGGNGLARFTAPIKLSKIVLLPIFLVKLYHKKCVKKLFVLDQYINNITRNEKFFNEITIPKILMRIKEDKKDGKKDGKKEDKKDEPDDTSPREQAEIDFLLSYKGEPLEPEWKWAEEMSFVYSWVNGSDPYHLDLKSKYNGGQKKADNRDRSMDELRYSLRSFENYLPWHKGTIYIVTPNQVPLWLDTDNPRIKVIDQDDIIPKEALPTFNSFFNEITYTHPRFFFADKTFAPKFYLGKKVPFSMKKALEMNETKDQLSMIKKFQSAVFYTNGIIKEAFGNSINLRWLDHSPYSWYRDLFEPARQLFSKYIKDSLTHRFRDPLDLIPTYGFQAYVMYGAAVPNYPEYLLVVMVTGRELAPVQLNKDRTIQNYFSYIVSPNVLFENLERNEKLYNDIHDIKQRLSNGFNGKITRSTNENLTNDDNNANTNTNGNGNDKDNDDDNDENPQNIDDGDEVLKIELEENQKAENKKNNVDDDTLDNANDVMDVIDSMNLMNGEQDGLVNGEIEQDKNIVENIVELNDIGNDEKDGKEQQKDKDKDNDMDKGMDKNMDKDKNKENDMDKNKNKDNKQDNKQDNNKNNNKDTKINTEINHDLDVLLNYNGGELEPEWEWAKDMSFVYTWINGSDYNHLDLKAKYNGGNRKVNNRDRSVGELRYSLRSLEKYLPWHRGMIFIVSPNQIPDFIDTNNPRIKVINQDDLLPPHVAPTFNSFVIELYLDKIPGLSERFVHLNDDYFFNNYVHPSFFFTPKTFYPRFYQSNNKVRSTRESAEAIAKMKKAHMIRKFRGSVYNTNDAVKQAFGRKASISWLDHSPYSWYRDLYEPARKVYEKQVQETLLHKFRHPLDLIPTYAIQAFIRYATEAKDFPKNVGGLGKAKNMAPLELNSNRTITDYSYQIVPQEIRRKVLKFGSILNNIERNQKLFDRILNSDIIMFNLNDDYQKKEALYQLVNFMKNQYPKPSSFEKKEYLEQEEALAASQNIDVDAKIVGDSALQNTNENGEIVNDNNNNDDINNNNNNNNTNDTKDNNDDNSKIIENYLNSNSTIISSSDSKSGSNLKSIDQYSDREKEEIDFLLNYKGEELDKEWQWAKDISFVYIWVNDTDPDYINLRKDYIDEKLNKNKNIKKYDELQYSLRSIEKYLPWHQGNIYIVTPGQVPNWLNTSNKRIKIINEKDIIPSEAVPTFNIFVLEMYLDKIPGISERFVYFNNNHYFKEYTHPRFFFSKDFGPKYFVNNRKVPHDKDKALSISEKKKLKNYQKFQSSLYYTNGIIKEVFGESVGIRYIERAPLTWYRDLFEPARMIYREYVEETIKHKFINALDIIPNYALMFFNIYGAANPFFPEILSGDGTAWNYNNVKLNTNRTIDFYSYDIVSPSVRSNTIKSISLNKGTKKNLNNLKSIEDSSVLFYSIKLQVDEKYYYNDIYEFMNNLYPEKSHFEN